LLLTKRERSDEAEAAFRVAIDSCHPDEAPKAALNLGRPLEKLERFDEAEVAFRSAIDSGHPTFAPLAEKLLRER
jgi:tetratricopeptide (TPR) repeat protein